MNYQILTGDNRHTLKTIADNSIDAIVTDPPYGIDFLGKSWDATVGALETYRECLRVLKPGGHIVAFSAPRTYHHLAVTLEQAGFEIRDQIMWIYSSGFPKSQDIGKSIERAEKKRKSGKGFTPDAYTGTMDTSSNNERAGGIGACGQCGKNNMAFPQNYNACSQEPCFMREQARPANNEWAGWGTQLKPAHEPICLARKPIKLSIAKNCQEWGVGALNIDATRIPATDLKPGTMGKAPPNLNAIGTSSEIETSDEPWIPNDAGRFPSNVIGEIPDYQKYFYCPKVGRAERHIGFDLSQIPVNEFNDPEKVKNHPLWDESIGTSVSRLQDKIRTEDKKGNGMDRVCETCGVNIMRPKDCHCPTKSWVRPIKTGNSHPTVKPIELMKYLIKLITPAGGTVLDPFNGSGSTGCAAVELGHPYIGCELDPRYVEISQRRIEGWYEHTNPTTFRTLFTTE